MFLDELNSARTTCILCLTLDGPLGEAPHMCSEEILSDVKQITLLGSDLNLNVGKKKKKKKSKHHYSKASENFPPMLEVAW